MTATVPTAIATSVDVEFLGVESYEIAVRDHRVRVDQPLRDGGADQAPTPTELFVGSLAACVAFYAGRYLTRHGYDRDGLRVHADFEMAGDGPARVAAIRLTLRPPARFPAERVPALLAVAAGCTVHNTINTEPDITITVE
jgi:putative redox protein